MHSATTATGRPLLPSGRSLPKIHPAPLSCRAARQLTAPKPHVTDVTSHRQCYIEAPAPTRHSSGITSHRKINRRPQGLEFAVSRTKQTLAPPINRQLSATSKIAPFGSRMPSRDAHFSISNHHNQNAAPALARHSSLITRHCGSNRHTARLENATSRRKQTLGTHSNRHFLQVSANTKRQVAHADRPTHNTSNRQWQILEHNVNHSKQTIAPRSNRHKNAIFASRIGGRTRFHATRKQPTLRAGIFWGLSGSRQSADAGRRSFRSNCRKAPGR
jgi:hypothetical protein